MDLRILTAASVLAAMGMLAGCGSEEPGEPTAGDDAAYRENTADPAPAPESAVPGTEPTTGQGTAAGQEPTTAGQPGTGQEMAGGESPSDPAAQSPQGTTQAPGQSSGQMDQDTTGEAMGMTEFAALDTNSDGRIAEDEWQPEVADGMEFQEIDEDGSGDIDRQEFQQAVGTSTGSQTGQDAPDPTTP